MEEDLIQFLKRRFSELQLKRSGFNNQFSDLQKFVRPDSSSFTAMGAVNSKGESTWNDIFDSTACWAAEQFANGMHSSVTNPTDRWFQINLLGGKDAPLPRHIQSYLDDTSDIMYYHLSRPEANFNPTLHENYLDLGVFGTDCAYQEWNYEKSTLLFKSVSLGDIHMDEGYDGTIDTVFRKKIMTKRQVLQEFPAMSENAWLKTKKDDSEIEVIHSVFPRVEWKYGLAGKDKPFASVYWVAEAKLVLAEGGYDSFPYHISRWTKQTGEVFGRGPGMSVLPSIRLINLMKKELIISAQLANRPPLIADEDSLLMPAGKKNFSLVPGSLLYKTLGSERPEAFNSGSQPQLTQEMIDNEQSRITQAFYVDYLLRQRKKERQSVLEIQDDRGEMMRQMAPMCGRIETEKLGPLLARSFYLLNKHRMLPEMPEELVGTHFAISYTSPVARAQIGAKGSQFSGFLQDITPWGNIFPSMLQKLDDDFILRQMAESRSLPVKTVRSPEEIQQMQQASQQQQQQQAMTEAAPQISKAMKDVAEARQIDPSIAGMLG